MKNNIFGDEYENIDSGIKKDKNSSKYNEILDNLNNLLKDKILKELGNNSESQEIAKLAGTFILELEVFLSTNEKI